MLLDTCVISEVAKRRPAPHVVDWFERTSDSDLFLSVLTIGEIAKGCTKVDDVLRKGRLEAWLASLRVEFSERILAIDERTADTWGRISGDAEIKGTPIPTIDGLLAADRKSVV